MHQIIVDGETAVNEALTLTERREARRESLKDRCKAAAELINNSSENWLVWCDLNDEADTLDRMIDGSKNVQGSDSPEYKPAACRMSLESWADALSVVSLKEATTIRWSLMWLTPNRLAVMS